MTTATQSLTLVDVLGAAEGSKFKITTDNELYGATVMVQSGTLINVRNGLPMIPTIDLIHSKFRAVKTEHELSLSNFLEAYRAGEKLKIVMGDRYRFIQKEEDDRPEELKQLMSILPVHVVHGGDFMTMEELLEGKFYIIK